MLLIKDSKNSIIYFNISFNVNTLRKSNMKILSK